MRRREFEEDDSPYLFCEMCAQMYERAEVLECPYCEKRFCRACAVRSGSHSFCGKSCAKNWFFADDEEDSAGAGDRGEQDKGDH